MQKSEETCEVVQSQNGKDKLNVHGYLIVKEKNVGNKYYWCCKFRKSKKYNGYTTTLLIKNLHYLQDMSEHKHLPDASHVEVVKAITEIKKHTSQSKEKPIQLIQNYMATLPEDIKLFLPSHNALRKAVVHFRKTVQLLQLQHALDFDLPLTLCNTLNVELSISQMQNSMKAWHNRWNTIVGKPNVSVYTLIEELQKEQQNVDNQVVRILQGELRLRPNQYYIEKKKRIMAIKIGQL
ncbi:12099_t:CDS:2 [Dentiscutata heterogama]|uniref:12099_t:CDS:1 n=1 Tax=Dentiscutata heterogama TaxID=1316150 RepID=A0ACA9N1H9_9GLOM|nr:12099_t:CDS:2 [Dentiscutata heterogama]